MEAVLEAVTAEQVFENPPNGWYELVRGKIIEPSPAGFEHGEIAGDAFAVIRSFVRKKLKWFLQTIKIWKWKRKSWSICKLVPGFYG